MSTQAAGVVPAFIDILTETSDAVEDVAGFTLAAVRAYQVDATVTCTDLFGAFTLVDIDASRAFLIQVVSSTTVDGVPLAAVGADGVDADLPAVAGARLAYAFIDVDAVAEGVLDEAGPTLHLGGATEGPLGVLAL